MENLIKFTIRLKPNENALELYAPSWEEAKKDEAYQRLIAEEHPRSLQIVRGESHPFCTYEYFGDENILSALREKLDADYTKYLAKWREAYEQNGELSMEQLRELCIVRTAYRNLINCGKYYPQEYMQALAEEKHPLRILSRFYENTGRFNIEPEAEDILETAFRDKDSMRHESINQEAVKLTGHAQRMELLDRTLDREHDAYEKEWEPLNFDGLYENAMKIYTLRQLYNTLRFEKNLYSADHLDSLALLAEPMEDNRPSLVGRRDLEEYALNRIRDILPQMYPDVIPEYDPWHDGHKAQNHAQSATETKAPDATERKMNFYEKELRMMFEDSDIIHDAKYCGKTMLGKLDGELRVKLQFACSSSADQYNAIRAAVINRTDGVVDQQVFRFADIIGDQNRTGLGRIEPHIWEYNNKPDWYIPVSDAQKQQIAETVLGYIGMYQEEDIAMDGMML